jgi:small subunit ribosomal protein S21
MRLKEHFEKPSVRKTREKKEASSRQRKLARKKAEREG